MCLLSSLTRNCPSFGMAAVVCIQAQLCILLTTEKPSSLPWGLKRRLCREPSFPNLSFLVSCWNRSCRLWLSNCCDIGGVGVRGSIYWVWQSQKVTISSSGPQRVEATCITLQDVSAMFLWGRRGSQVGKTSGYQRVFCWNCVEAGSTGDASC